MAKRWYGNVINRLEEGRTIPEITVGTDITKYHWSDRTCYYVTGVEDQKRIQVKEYYVCADKDKTGGMGHQNWLYFKSKREMYEYLNEHDCDYDLSRVKEDEPETWVYRYNKWYREFRMTEDNYCTEKELKSLAKKGYYNRYMEVGNISFGVRNYYYDWEF